MNTIRSQTRRRPRTVAKQTTNRRFRLALGRPVHLFDTLDIRCYLAVEFIYFIIRENFESINNMVIIRPAATAMTMAMKTCQGRGYGAPQDMLTVESNVKIPSLVDIPPKERKDWAIIKVHAVALAPGDCRVLSGKTSPLQGPRSFPYVPGGDVCGVITELDEDAPADLPFKNGDRVCAMFHGAPAGPLVSMRQSMPHQCAPRCQRI